MVSVDLVLSSLKKVVDPELHKDIVSMGMIKDLELIMAKLPLLLNLLLLLVRSIAILNRTFKMLFQAWE